LRDFVLTLFTDDPVLARAADRAGIDRIGVDLEYLNKAARQAGTNSRFSGHKIEALAAIAPVLRRAALFARCNPLNEGSATEVEALLEHGVGVLMLPYFKKTNEAAAFCRLVDGRALVVGLAETVEALQSIPELAQVPGLGEIHFGLNDLRLQMGFQNHFDVLATKTFQRAAAAARASVLPFGIAAVAQPHDKSLPVDPLEVCRSIVGLGATRALVARSFFGGSYDLARLPDDVARLRRTLAEIAQQPSLQRIPA
jgi:citrate lyase beta subunit